MQSQQKLFNGVFVSKCIDYDGVKLSMMKQLEHKYLAGQIYEDKFQFICKECEAFDKSNLNA